MFELEIEEHQLIKRLPPSCVATFDRCIFFDLFGTRSLSILPRQCTNSGNYLSLQLLRTLEEIYHTSERPLHCQYGAITGLAMLGSDVRNLN